MKLMQYKDYNHYVSAQIEANKAKLAGVWAVKKEIIKISDYVKAYVPDCSFGICHGVRNGWEVKQFKALLNTDVIGTEISETANQFEDVIQWDFHKIKDEWIDNVDFIYSNSWDHSYDPPYCLDQWMKCIKPSGRCFIEWSIFHGEESVDETDCFGASIEEYKKIINKKYQMENIIEIRLSIMKQIVKHILKYGISGILSIKRPKRFILVIKHKNHEETKNE